MGCGVVLFCVVVVVIDEVCGSVGVDVWLLHPSFLRFASSSLLLYSIVSKEYDIINGARESYDTRLLSSSAVVKFIRSTFVVIVASRWLKGRKIGVRYR